MSTVSEREPCCCGHCNKALEAGAMKRCGACKQRHYCSVECQRKDWPAHKAACKKSQTGQAADAGGTKIKKAKHPSRAVLKGKVRSHHSLFWYPKRCERDGCTVTDELLACQACKMVQYCGVQHQTEDWPIHKSDCATFKRNAIGACFYTDERILAEYPLIEGGEPLLRGDHVLPGNVPDLADSGSGCLLCGRTYGQPIPLPLVNVPLGVTQCCRQPVCDTEDDYQMFSYSREHCIRSHRRYTLCGNHGVEPKCSGRDFRLCSGCRGDGNPRFVADFLWRGLNPYNFCPLLAKDVPRHALCDTCARCRRKFLAGLEGVSFRGGHKFCVACGELGLSDGSMTMTMKGMPMNR